MRSCTLAALSAALLLMPVTTPAQSVTRGHGVPSPASILGFEPGADRHLPSWQQVVRYFTALDRASPRVSTHVIGNTTLGRPFLAVFIGDSATLADLPTYRAIQRKLADPRLQRPGERASLIARDKAVVLVTSSIHSTEVGGILTPLVLAYRLATQEDAESRAIRANDLVILVPSLNPDGVDIVGNWYRSTLGTPWEGSSPPVIYNKYTGHDDNRDWYAFTQIETQLTVDSLHNVWHPVVVNDIHQQGSSGSRLFLPPFMDPWEPNVDPIITAGVNSLGMDIAWRLTAEGKRGIATDARYDAWTPARSYQHYHAGVRILTETASARLATPIDIPFDSLHGGGPGFDPQVRSWNFAAPWLGGHWTLHDILGYQTAATWALLAQVAESRTAWLTSFARIGERAVQGRAATGRHDWPVGFVIPAQQRDPAALATMLRIMQRGQVEVRQSRAPFSMGSERYPAGTDIIFTAQPYGSFAKALLEVQHYPDLHQYPGGPPKRPYDVTAQTLPLLMGVTVATMTDSVPVPVTAPIAPIPAPTLRVPGLTGTTSRRIAIYKSYVPSMDEGWTRWVFDQYHVPFTSIVDRDVRAGKLNDRFDVILLPDERPRAIARGATRSYPDSLKGGLGAAGAAALAAFVRNGGTLVTFNAASEYAIQALGLPVKNVLAGVPDRDFYAPGSILRVIPNPSHPLAAHMATPAAIWFQGGPAFQITDSSRATAVASYPEQGNPLLSGWLLGGSRLHGMAALVDVREGAGHVLLFGFRPQYRAQTMATYPLMWGAMGVE
ncbi:MAG TPA: M14 family zinc carboxypeptidase [Gemmatimonadaceae bacterium]|nr:M14 family zinc carboxypeptidase [Gemmatimonadaceae bacterium]